MSYLYMAADPFENFDWVDLNERNQLCMEAFEVANSFFKVGSSPKDSNMLNVMLKRITKELRQCIWTSDYFRKNLSEMITRKSSVEYTTLMLKRRGFIRGVSHCASINTREQNNPSNTKEMGPGNVGLATFKRDLQRKKHSTNQEV